MIVVGLTRLALSLVRISRTWLGENGGRGLTILFSVELSSA